MAELDTGVIDSAKNGKFSEFADVVKKVLSQKVQNHPFIQAKKEEYIRNTRIKDAFAQIDTYLDTKVSPEE